MMTMNPLRTNSPKRRRIMIITADEDIIDEIERTNDVSLLTQIVIDSQTGQSKNHDQQMNVQLLEQKNKINHGSLTCVVCGSPATGYNFGAIACESCKAFFRRNALKDPGIFKCQNNHNCEIRLETRRTCPTCRLAKCYNNGMQRNRLTTKEQKVAKRRKIEENRSLTLNSNSKMNEGQNESSIVYDSELLPPIDTNILLLTDFSDLFPSQSKQISLSLDDLQRLENISLSYKKRIELANRDGLPWNSSTNTINFLETLNSHSVSVMRLLSFFKQIPEFNQLNVDDKVTLIKFNLTIALFINGVLSYNTKTHQIIETDSDPPVNLQMFNLIHGYSICTKLGKVFNSFVHITNYDKKIIELLLVILILTKGFSTADIHEPILNDPMSVYRAQNSYIELLWKYMEITHGFKVAVNLFSKLIVDVISWQTVQEDMRNNVLRILSPEDIDRLVPIMKSVLLIS